jgi:DNA-binding MarR family transcriptional regulator
MPIKEENQITKPQFFLLYYINQLGSCKLTQLAEKMDVKPSAISVMIDRMEKAGFVTRTYFVVDRRSVLIQVTPLGKQIIAEEIGLRNKIIEGYLSNLNKEEAIILTELLEKMMSSNCIKAI